MEYATYLLRLWNIQTLFVRRQRIMIFDDKKRDLQS